MHESHTLAAAGAHVDGATAVVLAHARQHKLVCLAAGAVEELEAYVNTNVKTAWRYETGGIKPLASNRNRSEEQRQTKQQSNNIGPETTNEHCPHTGSVVPGRRWGTLRDVALLISPHTAHAWRFTSMSAMKSH